MEELMEGLNSLVWQCFFACAFRPPPITWETLEAELKREGRTLTKEEALSMGATWKQ